MAVNDIFKVTTMLVVDGTPCTITQGYKQTVDNAQPHQAGELAAGWPTLMKAAILACVTPKCALSHTYVHRVAPTPDVPGLATYDESADIGTFAGEVLPPNIAVCFNLITTLGTGRHNGRVFLPGIPETVVVGNLLDATYASTQLALVAVKLLAHVTNAGSEFRPVVIQRTSLGAPLVPPIGNTLAQSGISTWISQIRRRTARTTYVP